MNARPLQSGSVATNVAMPWLLLLLIVAGLTGYRYHQAQESAAMDAHIELHHKAVQLALDLRFLAQERWSNALAYQATRDARYVVRLEQSQLETARKLDELTHLFSNNGEHYDARVPSQAQALLDSYQVIHEGVPELYAQLILAIDAGDLGRQMRVTSLLSDKIRLVRATLDDLAAFHIKTEQSVNASQKAMQRQADLVFIGLLGALILAGLGFSRYQTLAIVRPLSDLTLAAREVGAGKTADLSRFKGQGEIGQLGHAFSQMVDKLQQSHRELSAQKDQLALAYADVEGQVKQRTTELQRRSEELETANKDLEGFSYSVSHDLRAPLRAIDGFIAILREDYGAKLDAEGLRLFSVVSDNARKMGHLIDDILAFSRAGRLELEHARVDMNAMVDEVWNDLAGQRGERVIEFHRADLPAVTADPRALRQVWQNLLGNALKFSRDRTPARIEVSAKSQDNLIWFQVKDNGAGFNPDYVDKLFGLFMRLHGMDEFDGTGVGLAIVKRFVSKHGGRVAAEGAVGIGAMFSFGLPTAPVQATSEEE